MDMLKRGGEKNTSLQPNWVLSFKSYLLLEKKKKRKKDYRLVWQ